MNVENKTIDELYIRASELGEKINAKFGEGAAWKLYQQEADKILRMESFRLMKSFIAEMENKLKELGS